MEKSQAFHQQPVRPQESTIIAHEFAVNWHIIFTYCYLHLWIIASMWLCWPFETFEMVCFHVCMFVLAGTPNSRRSIACSRLWSPGRCLSSSLSSSVGKRVTGLFHYPSVLSDLLKISRSVWKLFCERGEQVAVNFISLKGWFGALNWWVMLCRLHI